MTSFFTRAATAAGVLAAGAAATVAFAAPASAAYFPFPSCHQGTYYNGDGSVQAVFNHYDGRANLNFYLLYVYGRLPNPNNINDSANWSSCVPN
ncbi:hypothetical protein OG738_25385 [Amycolatopsis sp. NBC_01488]|uniref:hypothetical protein n=1 Tax=Amycolatopsis sp. NBC_01488 TaxID=2903563 RepID=UPI002E2AFDD9|nr:hypothetical protein [Amycolatopsis sp. NBC_01488]